MYLFLYHLDFEENVFVSDEANNQMDFINNIDINYLIFDDGKEDSFLLYVNEVYVKDIVDYVFDYYG